MIVRLKRHWKHWKPGKVFNDMPDGQGNLLIREGFGEQVKPEPQQQPRSVKRAGRA